MRGVGVQEWQCELVSFGQRSSLFVNQTRHACSDAFERSSKFCNNPLAANKQMSGAGSTMSKCDHWSKSWLDARVEGKSVREHLAIIAADERVFTPKEKIAKFQAVAARLNAEIMPKASAHVKHLGKAKTLCSGPDITGPTCQTTLNEMMDSFAKADQLLAQNGTGTANDDDRVKAANSELARVFRDLLQQQSESLTRKVDAVRASEARAKYNDK